MYHTTWQGRSNGWAPPLPFKTHSNPPPQSPCKHQQLSPLRVYACPWHVGSNCRSLQVVVL